MDEIKQNSNQVMYYVVGLVIIAIAIWGISSYKPSKSKESEPDKMAYDAYDSAKKTTEQTDEYNDSADSNSEVSNLNEGETMEGKLSVQDKLKVTKPQMVIDKSKSYEVVVTTTDGVMKIKLNAEKTPITVNNFVYLAKMGFYDDVIFHRVIKNFMIQTGDPLGTGIGGPAYKFDDEPFEGEYTKGIVAMANAGPNTNGSQFFVMHSDVPLPKNYVIFGEVTEGLDVLDKIANQDVVMGDSGEVSKPVTPTRIISVAVEEK